jgi:hypothetical protein
MKLVAWCKDKWYCWRTDQVRVAPLGVRGRVYRKKNDPTDGQVKPAKTRPEGTISARVYRAATGKWEDLGVISQPEEKR